MKMERSNFSWALNRLKEGLRVRRRGWNGKVLWLKAQYPDEHSKMTLPYIYMEYPSWGEEIKEGNPIYPEGCRVPWLASQSDFFAEDWELLPE